MDADHPLAVAVADLEEAAPLEAVPLAAAVAASAAAAPSAAVLAAAVAVSEEAAPLGAASAVAAEAAVVLADAVNAVQKDAWFRPRVFLFLEENITLVSDLYYFLIK